MSVRRKIILIFTLVFVCLLLVIYFMSQQIIMRGFLGLEKENLEMNMKRAQGAIYNEAMYIYSKVSDWSSWDDAYDFIENSNPAFVKSNTQDTAFLGLKINFMIFFNSSGKLIFGKWLDLEQRKEVPISENILKEITGHINLLSQPEISSGVNGIIILDGGPALVALRPILNSNGQGPSRGVIIFGRNLDASEVKQISNITSLPIKIERLDRASNFKDFDRVRQALSRETPSLVLPLNSTNISGYAILEDIHHKNNLVLRIDVPRYIYKQGYLTIIYFIFALSFLGFVFGSLVLFFLNKFILSPLSSLSASVSGIGVSAGASLRLSVFGKDEIASLAHKINEMLEKLENSRDELQESQERYISLVENVNSIVLKMDTSGKIAFWNRFAEDFFGYTEREILGRPVVGTIVSDSEDANNYYKQMFSDIYNNPEVYSSRISENIKKNGQRVWISWTNRAIMDKSENLAGVLCVGNDVTGFKKMENRLIRLNKVFLTLGTDFDKNINLFTSTCGELLESSCALYSRLSDGMLYTLCQWNVPQGRSAIYKPEGHICYDLIKRNQRDVFIVKNLDRTDYFISDPNVVALGLKTYVGYPVYSFGECIGSLCVVYQEDVDFDDNDKRVLEIIASAIGIEEERRFSEEAIRKSRDFYLTLFERVPTPIWRAGVDARYDYFNKAWLKFTGRPINKELGQGWIESAHPEDQDKCLNNYLDAFNKRESFEIEFRLRRYDGMYRWVVQIGAPFYDLKGKFAGYVGSLYEIAGKKPSHQKES